MMQTRRETRALRLGETVVGGGAPISIQSMTSAPPSDSTAVLAQINQLSLAGCEIVRCALPNSTAAETLPTILASSPLPVIADIHFDWRLALAAIEAGAHGIRINPGNIGSEERLREVARACADSGTVVRIGVNGGSLDADLLERHGGPTPQALTESAVRACETMEEEGCATIKVSLKVSSVRETVEANRLFAARTDYPLHLGVTEAGAGTACVVKSAIGIGALLLDGIGDTIRVSMTGGPVEEVRVARHILQSLGLRHFGPDLVACPTCGRTAIDLTTTVRRVEEQLAAWRAAGRVPNVRKVAIMGCAVNGPGEARDADIGIAGGNGKGVLFRRGEVCRSVPESELAGALVEELERHLPPST